MKKDINAKDNLNIIITYVLPVVLIHIILYKGICWISTLSFSSYEKDIISLELIKRIIRTVYLPILILATILIFRKTIFISWGKFEKGKTVRLFVVLSAIIIAWYYSTYSYNFYFDQSHIADRILLILFVLAIYWKPIFVFPFLLILFSVIFQFESFLGYPTAASPFLLTRVLILFLAFLIYRILFKKFFVSIFLFLLCCLIGTHYFTPGFGKLNSEWIFNNHINYLLAATYTNGWLSFLDHQTISSFVEFLDNFNVPLRIFTLIIECGVLFLFFHLKYVRFIFIGAIIMHLGIFLYSGIFFWMWISLLIIVLVLFLKKDLPINNIFNKYYFIAGFILIGTGKFWASAGGLNWHDSPLSYTYKIEAETKDGEVLQLPPNFFSSYEFQFIVSNFKYLNDDKRLPIIWGATDNFTSNYLNKERTVEEIFKYEEQKGKIYKKESSKEIFIDFIKTFVSNRNKNLEANRPFLKFVKAPSLYWSFPYNSTFSINKEIRAINVNEVTTYFTKEEGYREIRHKKIIHIKIY